MNTSAYFLTEQDAPLVKSTLLSGFPELIQGTSTRKGGVSTGIHESMNLGFNNGDIPENVSKNYEIICRSLGIKPSQIVTAKQTHKTNVRIVTQRDSGKGVVLPVNYDDIDALVTNKPTYGPSPVLCILTADCLPVFVYDPKHMAIGLAHSGWRGTVNRIVPKMLEKMEQAYETDPNDVYLSIGPSICKKCYEVGDDVAEEFKKAFNRTELRDILFEGDTKGKYRLNLAAAVTVSAAGCGVLPENIENQGLCTACNSKLLFSHRITMGKRGTLASFLGIR
ncbi:MAG: peptidoglycan editing factor PgeF [Lachnospiraceae bacterium]|nr:peptidoglycan editing factor PgeF [Lachnospiraceae bacterium]